ncbi:hypothetical protein D3C72_2026620 [compost metagenome]
MNGDPNTFRHASRLLRCRTRQHNAELLTAHAPCHIAISQRVLNQPGRVGQHFVPRLMTKSIVNAFEMVEIELNDRERQLLLTALLGQSLCSIKERTAVVEPGERIVPGLPLQ